MKKHSSGRALSIAQFAPLVEPVPPTYYGGIERVVYHLTEELTRLGHRVTLFASGDSKSSASLVSCCSRSLRLNPTQGDPMPAMLKMLSAMRKKLEGFDILHFHTDLIRYPIFREVTGRAITTVHMPPNCPVYGPRFESCPNTPVVAISGDQRSVAPAMNWVGTVHHGFPLDLFAPMRAPLGGYLAFLSRLEHDKRPDRAIDIAKRAGIPIKLAGKVGQSDQAYFDCCVKPMLDGQQAVYLGEISESEKQELLGNSIGLVFPIGWREAFGLVMIEAMACGTPVLAFSRGSVREIVEHGVTGFVVEGVQEAVATIGRLSELDRGVIRRRFEEKFSSARMTKDYLRLYDCMLNVPAAPL